MVQLFATSTYGCLLLSISLHPAMGDLKTTLEVCAENRLAALLRLISVAVLALRAEDL